MCAKKTIDNMGLSASPLVEIKDGDRVLYSNHYPLKLIINSKSNFKKINSPEAALWQAVLIQALEDATSNSKQKKKLRYKRQAREWLKNPDNDLKKICLLAGVRYDSLIKLMDQLW